MKRKIELTHVSSLVSFCILIGFAAFPVSCHYHNLEKKLTPHHSDFYQKVHYIMTNQESRMFLDLPDAEKNGFIEEFWRRRDPDPGTEENDFKIEYFNRLDTTENLFHGEGKPGWMTDRGRIYILFGPPMDRLKNPMGYSSSTQCSEVWFYGNFPVIFSDPTCMGTFKLVTYDFSPIRSLNLMYMHALNMAQARSQQTLVERDRKFNFEWEVVTSLVSDQRIEGVISMNIPYANIWFAGEGELLQTVLDIHFELQDSEERTVWEHDVEKSVEIEEKDLEKDRSRKFILEVPFVLTEDISSLRFGANKLYVTLRNKTGGSELKKFLEVKF
ncbi:GWxTD domain-containing protein [Acidobacteriota bacterium]